MKVLPKGKHTQIDLEPGRSLWPTKFGLVASRLEMPNLAEVCFERMNEYLSYYFYIYFIIEGYNAATQSKGCA